MPTSRRRASQSSTTSFQRTHSRPRARVGRIGLAACVGGHAARTIEMPRQRLPRATTCSAVFMLDAWLSPISANVPAASAAGAPNSHSASAGLRGLSQYGSRVPSGLEGGGSIARRSAGFSQCRAASRAAAPKHGTKPTRPTLPSTEPASGTRSVQVTAHAPGAVHALPAHHV